MDAPDDGSVADRLAAELEQGGEYVDAGGFDIDAGRALAKLEGFLLAEPRAYVLRLAEAGLLAGATRLRFDVDGASLRVSFDRTGDPVVLPVAALERLTAVLVSRAGVGESSVARPVLLQLAVAAVAIHRLAPVYFAIESVAADGRGHRHIYVPEAKTERIADAEPGTRIYVSERIGLGNIVDGVFGERVEQTLLIEHCRLATTPIFLDGRRISGTRLLARAVVAEPVVDEHGVTIGEAGFVGNEEPARVLLLSRGLLIESLRLLDCQPGFLAALDVPLGRDLSQSAIARTPELDAALAPVYRVHARLAPRAMNALQRRTLSVPARKGSGNQRLVGALLLIVIVFPIGAMAAGLPPIFVMLAVATLSVIWFVTMLKKR